MFTQADRALVVSGSSDATLSVMSLDVKTGLGSIQCLQKSLNASQLNLCHFKPSSSVAAMLWTSRLPNYRTVLVRFSVDFFQSTAEKVYVASVMAVGTTARTISLFTRSEGHTEVCIYAQMPSCSLTLQNCDSGALHCCFQDTTIGSVVCRSLSRLKLRRRTARRSC